MYGRSGTGKTRLWGSFPGRTRCYVCSGGNKPTELRSIDSPENRKRIFPYAIKSTEELELLLREEKGYDNYVLDHAGGLADLRIKEMLGLDKIPVSKSRKASKGESWSLVSQQQYGELAVYLKEFFRDLLNLPGNVIVVAHERTFGGRDEGGGDVIQPTVGAALTPSVTGWLNGAVSYICQTFVRPKVERTTAKFGNTEVEQVQRVEGAYEYCLRTGAHDVYQTKFRLPPGGKAPPDCIVIGPDESGYEKFMEVLRGK